MKAIKVAILEFAQDEEGITAIEYGLLAAVVAGVIAAAFTTLGGVIKDAFNTIGTRIEAALDPAS